MTFTSRSEDRKKVQKGKDYKGIWWGIMDSWKIGIIPLPLFVLAGILILIESMSGDLSSNIVVMIAVLAFFGFACGEIGKRIPIIGKMGAAAICATFIPSALVYYKILPDIVVKSTTQFFQSTNILYLYIACIIVGSILSMNRQTLIKGFIRIIFPMICGEIVGMLVGMAVGMMLGMDPFHIFFFLILPIMAGGVGEGAIPLSIGYEHSLHMSQGVALGQILPMVMLGNLIAIVLAGLLNTLGKRYPRLTGEGNLFPDSEADKEEPIANLSDGFSGKVDAISVANGLLLAALLYMVGMVGQKLINLPAPVGMLFVVVFIKMVHGVSPSLLAGSQFVYKLFQMSVTYPVLFAVGVAITPWEAMIEAFTLSNLIVITSSVVGLVATGFFVGRKIGMYPIDVAIVSCCQSGQGGTGAVAILTASDRMKLMPFAQIATRIGGAINVSLSLLVLGTFLV